MQLIMHGYVPPNMSPQQAAMLFNSLPNNLKSPHVPEPGTPEWIAVMSREPIDPETGLPFSLKEKQVQATNQRIAEECIRERFGPVYVPPLHPGHALLAQYAQKTANGVAGERKDNQLSALPTDHQKTSLREHQGSITEMTDASGNIVWQGSYEPYGNVTTLQGTAPPDFMYQGMYHLQRPNLYLTPNRVYSPSLGRWLSRDPVDDPAFRLRPRSPEPRTPSSVVAVMHHSSGAPLAALQSVSRDPMIMAQLGMLIPQGTLPPREWNPYVYVRNNPINYNDPSGLMIAGFPQPKAPGKQCPTNPSPSDPEEEWNECLVRCNGWGEGTPEWEQCMYECLGGY
jgi:RHS repeat-associated protein